MLRIVIISLLLHISIVLLYDQKGYIHKCERAESISYNHQYVKYFKVVSFKYNRTSVAINLTLFTKIDLLDNLKVEVQAYKFLSNEYRHFPMRFSYNFCEAVAKNDFGLGAIYKCGNFSRCPIKKGDYMFCNWAPNDKKCPPNIPQGSYMLDLKFFLGDIELAFFRAYGTIEDINWWDRH